MFADFCEIRHGVDSKRTLNSFFVFSTNIYLYEIFKSAICEASGKCKFQTLLCLHCSASCLLKCCFKGPAILQTQWINKRNKKSMLRNFQQSACVMAPSITIDGCEIKVKHETNRKFTVKYKNKEMETSQKCSFLVHWQTKPEKPNQASPVHETFNCFVNHGTTKSKSQLHNPISCVQPQRRKQWTQFLS